MPLITGDRPTHHHGLFAGLGAGTAAVLVCAVFVLSVWHRVSGTVALAVTVIVWALVAVLLVAAVYAVGFLGLQAPSSRDPPGDPHPARGPRGGHPGPGTACQRHAGIQPPAAAAELPAAGTHYHFDSAEAVETALRAMQERPDTESHHDPA